MKKMNLIKMSIKMSGWTWMTRTRIIRIRRHKLWLIPGLYILLNIFTAFDPSKAAANVSVTDAAGRVLVFDTLPKRIVVVGAAPFIPLHMLYLFEETKLRLKGFEIRIKAPDRFLNLIDPDLAKKQTLQSNPGPESVVALKPDLVISKAAVEGRLARSLAPLGIKVMYVGAETPDMFLADIKNLGKVFGNPERADRIIQYYTDKLSLIRQTVGSVPADEKPRVLVIEYSNRGNAQALNVPAMKWFQTQQAVISGGTPVWLNSLSMVDGWQITGFEQIAAWNPDKIFMVVWYQLKGLGVIQGLYRDSKWSRLTAVQQNNLFLYPKDIFGWDSATPRWILGALWMAKRTYPEKFGTTDPDMKDTAREFFKTLYRMNDATFENYILPEME